MPNASSGRSWAIVLNTGWALAIGCAGVAADPGGSGSTGGVLATGTGGAPLSGSGDRATIGGGGSSELLGVGGQTTAKTCGLQSFDLQRKPADLFLVLDRSASMQNDSNDKKVTSPTNPSKWSQLIPALTQVVSQTTAEIPWGMKAFPEDGSECSAGTVTSKVDVPIGAMNGSALTTAINAITPNGNGTPTGAAVGVAVSYLQTVLDGNPKYLVLATDGAPSCSGPAGNLTKSSTQGRSDAVAAVSAAAAAGIHTFVIGVATTSTNDTATLNNLAMAGLEAKSDPNPLAPKFYLASTQADLVNALGTITGMITTCQFPLNPTPPDPANIAVKVSGAKAPQDIGHTNGWDYTMPDHTAVTVYGAWCEMIKTSAANMVQIIYGCPNVVIP